MLESAASTPCQGSERYLFLMRRPTMLPLRRTGPRSVPILLLALLAASIGGPFAQEKKADDKKPDDKKAAKLDVNAVPENARHVAFTTDEGTWMSVDVSPDGAHI